MSNRAPMKSAESWVSVVSPAAHLGTPGELERIIARIQADALQHAADYLDSRGSTFTWDDAIHHLRATANKLAP